MNRILLSIVAIIFAIPLSIYLLSFAVDIPLGLYLLEGGTIHSAFPGEFKLLEAQILEDNNLDVKFSIGTKYLLGENSKLYDIKPSVMVYSGVRCGEQIGVGMQAGLNIPEISYSSPAVINMNISLRKSSPRLSLTLSADKRGAPTFMGKSDCLIVDTNGAGGLCSNALYSTEYDERRDDRIVLTRQSRELFRSNIQTQGNQALVGLWDLSCLQYLDLSGTNIPDACPALEANLPNLSISGC